MPYLMIKVYETLTNDIVSFEQLGPDWQIRCVKQKAAISQIKQIQYYHTNIMKHWSLVTN